MSHLSHLWQKSQSSFLLLLDFDLHEYLSDQRMSSLPFLTVIVQIHQHLFSPRS